MTQPAEVTLIVVGTRGRLKAAQAERWLLPERRFATEGRVATVVALPNPARGVINYRVQFDVKRKGATPYEGMVGLRDLELA